MKHILILIITVVSLQGCDKQIISCRQAKLQDIPQLENISYQSYSTDFKKMWGNSYKPIFPNIDSEQFVKEKNELNNVANKRYIDEQEKKESPLRLIVAEVKNKNSTPEIVGFCRFEKQDDHKIYMNFVLVDEKFRKQGIAKKLVTTAINTFPNITQCQFRALIHNTKINQIYTEHNCKQIGTVSLDIKTGKIDTTPNAPITHVDYLYSIEKQ